MFEKKNEMNHLIFFSIFLTLIVHKNIANILEILNK